MRFEVQCPLYAKVLWRSVPCHPGEAYGLCPVCDGERKAALRKDVS